MMPAPSPSPALGSQALPQSRKPWVPTWAHGQVTGALRLFPCMVPLHAGAVPTLATVAGV